jgi:hypothetical protein
MPLAVVGASLEDVVDPYHVVAATLVVVGVVTHRISLGTSFYRVTSTERPIITCSSATRDLIQPTWGG